MLVVEVYSALGFPYCVVMPLESVLSGSPPGG